SMPESMMELKLSAAADGRLTAMQASIVLDGAAGAGPQDALPCFVLRAYYRSPNHLIVVSLGLTNSATHRSYWARARPEADCPLATEPSAPTCMLNADGTLSVLLGSVDLSGTNTWLVRLAAEVFGLPPERVQVVTGDSLTAPFAGGTGGSKITYTVGPSVIQ